MKTFKEQLAIKKRATLKVRKDSWFFPAQKKVEKYLQDKFGDCWRLEFQNACEYVTYETYQCWNPKEEGKPQEQQRISFIIHKPQEDMIERPSIIETYYQKYEHTMQFFQDGH